MTSLFHKLRWGYIRNNLQSFFFTLFYLIITMALFIHRFIQYKDTTTALALARASAIVIYWQSGVIMVLILRRLISYLRSFGLARYLPLDHYVYFHKLTGWSIAFFSLIHTLAHLYNFNMLTSITTISNWRFLLSIDLGIGWFHGSACVTGWLLIIVLAIMLCFSISLVRRKGRFELFYYTHKLYVVYMILLYLHSKLVLHWLAGPLLFFLFEKITSFIRTHRNQHGQTYCIEGTMQPSRVLRLVIRKPKFFHFVPGDFVYLRIPSITKHEWHPMTISSAPEDKGIHFVRDRSSFKFFIPSNEELTVHIRAVGTWTNRLYERFEHAKTLSVKKMFDEWNVDFHPYFKDPPSKGFDNSKTPTMILPVPEDCDENGCGKKKSISQHEIEKSDLEGNKAIEMEEIQDLTKKQFDLLQNFQRGIQTNAVFLKEPLTIHLNGPYGAPSSNIFECEHAVLIATGIGVTPFASILQSIMYRHIEKTRNCPACHHSWIEKVPSPNINNLRKVDFIWINRNQTSFEWFVELLSNLAEQQSSISAKDDRFFDIQMYVTGEAETSSHPTRAKSHSFLNVANEAITLRFGRPEWDKTFAEIREKKRGKVTVFFCGRPDLSSYLRQKCHDNDFSFKKEVF